MNLEKKICLLCTFKSLNVTYHTQKIFYEFISQNFKDFYIINVDNLMFFAKPVKYNFSEEIHNRPKNIILFNPKNSKEFNFFIKDKILIAINNFGRSFHDFKIHLLIKKKNIHQIQFRNIGNIQPKAFVSYRHIFLTLYYFIENRLFRKITNFLSILGIVNKIEICFISNKEVLEFIFKNSFKKFLYNKKLLFAKEYVLVNSIFYDKINNNNQNKSNQYIVHLDHDVNYNHETRLRGELDEIATKNHYQSIRNFLLVAEKKLKKKVYISIHPLYPKEFFEKLYKEFEVIKYKTADLIRNADLVTFFDSSAIINAILLKKRIIQLNSKFLGKNEQMHTNTYKKKLDLVKVELDKFSEKDFDEIYKNSEMNNEMYNNYIQTFHCFDHKKKGIEKIVEIIKEKYF